MLNPERKSRIMKKGNRNSSATSLNSKASDKTKRSSWYGSTSTSEATRPDIGKAKTSSGLFNSLRGRKPAPRVPSCVLLDWS
jgi:hypothetical protein